MSIYKLKSKLHIPQITKQELNSRFKGRQKKKKTEELLSGVFGRRENWKISTKASIRTSII